LGVDQTEWSVNVIASYPHDPSAYTQGLIIHNGKMYEGTGQYGQSTVRQVDLSTGTIERRAELRYEHFGEGITAFNGELYQLTWKSGLGFVYALDTLTLLRTFRINGEGWGLTHDESSLIMSNGTSQLMFLDPKTFEIIHRLTVIDDGQPVGQLNELEFIHDEIWANIWFEERIARISPSTGEVLGWVDLSGLHPPSQRGYDDVLNGIAFDADSDRIFVTGKNWPRLFEIEVVPK
jgi:glutamine cyclotransferase